jgi:hypothetical protein
MSVTFVNYTPAAKTGLVMTVFSGVFYLLLTSDALKLGDSTNQLFPVTIILYFVGLLLHGIGLYSSNKSISKTLLMTILLGGTVAGIVIVGFIVIALSAV